MITKRKILFYDTKPYDRLFFDEANRDFGFDIQYFPGHLDAETAALSRGNDAVCVFVNDVLDKAVLAVLKENGIKVVALRCAGYNNVDLKSAYGSVHVMRVPGYSPNAVAEHAMALMLSLNRKTHKAYFRTRDGNFSINGLLGFDMNGKIMGVVGTGRIGRCLISIARGFGMRVLAYDTVQDGPFAREQGIRYVPLDELYGHADIISLHCPLTSGTYHMINEDSIRKMKKGVMLINTGRGKLIKTDALIKALKDKRIGAAGLDVYEEESQYFFEDFSFEMIEDDILARLLTFPNVLVTSHQGFFTQEALANISQTTLQNIRDFFVGTHLENEICYRCGLDASQCLKKQKKRCF